VHWRRNPPERPRNAVGKKGKPKGDRDGGGPADMVGVAGGKRKATRDDTCLNCN